MEHKEQFNDTEESFTPEEILFQKRKESAKKGRSMISKEQARANSRKGGLVTSSDREHMAAIGRKGGSRKKPRAKSPEPPAEFWERKTDYPNPSA